LVANLFNGATVFMAGIGRERGELTSFRANAYCLGDNLDEKALISVENVTSTDKPESEISPVAERQQQTNILKMPLEVVQTAEVVDENRQKGLPVFIRFCESPLNRWRAGSMRD
jgi:hypothetical protein